MPRRVLTQYSCLWCGGGAYVTETVSENCGPKEDVVPAALPFGWIVGDNDYQTFCSHRCRTEYEKNCATAIEAENVKKQEAEEPK